VLFRALFPLPEVIGFNRARYQMMGGSHLDARETIRRGLVYDRLLFESRPDGYSEVHRLNLYGFRGADFAIVPPVGRRRVLVIGDSVAEGLGAPESATISAQLAHLMARDGIAAEVINLGVVAADLPRLTALAREATALLQPLDVVLILNANDLPPLPFPDHPPAPPPRFRRRDSPWWLPRVIKLMKRVVDGRPIYRRWFHPLTRFFAPVPDPANPWTSSTGSPPDLDPALYRAMADGALNPWLKEHLKMLPGMIAYSYADGIVPNPYLYRIDQSCHEAGARLLVAFVPFSGVTHPRYVPALVALGMDRQTAERLSVDPVYRNQGAMLAQICPSLGLTLADTTDALIRAERETGPQFWSYDSHPRPAGYATIARRIYEVWRQSAEDGDGLNRRDIGASSRNPQAVNKSGQAGRKVRAGGSDRGIPVPPGPGGALPPRSR
jgi:lysophospholipase L1-like esterase